MKDTKSITILCESRIGSLCRILDVLSMRDIMPIEMTTRTVSPDLIGITIVISDVSKEIMRRMINRIGAMEFVKSLDTEPLVEKQLCL